MGRWERDALTEGQMALRLRPVHHLAGCSCLWLPVPYSGKKPSSYTIGRSFSLSAA